MPTQADLRQALELAKAEFQQKDPETQAVRSGSRWISPTGPETDSRVELPFLGKRYAILKSGEMHYSDTHEEPALWERILLLHYLIHASGIPLTGKHLSFGEIPEGRIYASNFEKRVIGPLLARYGTCPEEVSIPAESLHGSRIALGDFAVQIPLLPMVPVALIFWKPDEEFAPRLTILFDSTVTGYLPTEDIVVSSQMMALHLMGHRP